MADVENVLPWLEAGWVGVEIGVSEGHSAKRLLDHGVGFLYLIDLWEDYDGLLDKVTPGAFLECWRWSAHQEYVNRVRIIRLAAAEAVKCLPVDFIDFVWIDGNHRYEWVKSDLELYWPKIKPGGVLCGHDYVNNPPNCEVKRAVDEFVAANGLKLELALPCWIINVGRGNK